MSRSLRFGQLSCIESALKEGLFENFDEACGVFFICPFGLELG
jgi:hypothetical protein